MDQFQSRIYDGNLNSQNALNQELLLNVIRASRYQALNFVAVTQVTGGQMESLSTGLPTISVGPHQTAAEHIYQISNSVSSQVSGGYQSNPLLSTQFQEGMLSPVGPKLVAQLDANHPREIVLFALIDSIYVTSVKTKKVTRLVNDPDQDYDPDDASVTPEQCRLKYNPLTRFDDPALVKAKESYFPGTVCSYSKFSNLLKTLIAFGLSSEIIAGQASNGAISPPATSGASSASGAASPAGGSGGSTSTGRLCLDPSVYRAITNLPVCSAVQPQMPSAQNSAVVVSVKSKSNNTETTTTTTSTKTKTIKPNSGVVSTDTDGPVTFDIRYRSPFEVFSYFGSWIRNSRGTRFGDYVSRSANNILSEGEPYFNVAEGVGPACYTAIIYGAQTFCVPQNAYHTAMLLDILQNLRNVNIQASDLNSAFTVRLSSSP